MKRIIAIVVLGLLITSCADRGFNKSRYGKLNWINHGFEKKATPDEAKKESETEKINNSKVEFKADEIEAEDVKPEVSGDLDFKSDEGETIKTTESKTAPSPVTNPDITIVDKAKSSDLKEVSKQQVTNQDKSDTKDVSDDGIMLLILVILALIIPPVAVLVYEGVTTRFWLNLLFAILGGALFFVTPGLGIFALIAVVHALLIVLGII